LHHEQQHLSRTEQRLHIAYRQRGGVGELGEVGKFLGETRVDGSASAPALDAPAVLHADRMTQSASSLSSEISEAVRKPSSIADAEAGGVKTMPASAIGPSSPASAPWVTKCSVR
jgi:hypothetical protein